MTYATRQDMIDRFGEEDLIRLTDRAGALDAIDETVLDTALADAAATINGYIAKRYALPFDEVPRVLVRISCDLAFYALAGNQGGAQESAKDRHNAAIAFLKSVSRGEASLGDETADDTEAGSPGPVLVEGPDPVFSRDKLWGF